MDIQGVQLHQQDFKFLLIFWSPVEFVARLQYDSLRLRTDFNDKHDRRNMIASLKIDLLLVAVLSS